MQNGFFMFLWYSSMLLHCQGSELGTTVAIAGVKTECDTLSDIKILFDFSYRGVIDQYKRSVKSDDKY